jgi:hypothetical protein
MTTSLAVAVHHDTTRWHDIQRALRGALLASLLIIGFEAHAGVHMQGVHMQGVHMQGADLQGVHMQGVHMQGADLQGVHMQGVHMQGVHMQGVHMQGVHMQGVHMQGAALYAAGLQGRLLVMSRGGSDGTSIEIRSFRGDRVVVRMYDPATHQARDTEMHPSELVGATWSVDACDDAGACQTFTYRIASVMQDDSKNTMLEHADNRDIWLYQVEYVAAESGLPFDWKPVCDGGAGAPAVGVFVDGMWRADGTREDNGYTFSCLNGVIAKCMRAWGYKPWKTLRSREHGDVSLAGLHQMCTRAARADYCGDGNAHTREGTMVDIFDGYGLNVRDPRMSFAPESGFDASGARWVKRPRWPAGEPLEDGWRFNTCQRPASDATFQDEPARLEVWSDPLLGRQVE